VVQTTAEKGLAPLKQLFAIIQAIGQRITRLINFILVVLVYFLAIGPLSLVFRAFRRTPLENSNPHLEGSLWLERTPTPAQLERFTRQF